MKKRFEIRFLPIGLAVILLLIFSISRTENLRDSLASVKNMLASVFFTDSITETDLLTHYDIAKNGGKKVKIIIVPGHDDDSSGAIYRNRREADMTRELGEKLAQDFSGDPEFEVVLTRTDRGYNPIFWDYRERGKDSLFGFIKSKKADMEALEDVGFLNKRQGVKHNKAPSEMVTTLYSINRWANETGADIVLHIHFNDAAERRREAPYDYSGFSIYIPEKQYSNAKASRFVARPIFDRLSRFFPKSDLPIEDAGLVESQDLIAIGAYNTLDSVGMLIEYGYIYEPQFDSLETREKTIDELAWQTYLGLHDFFRTKKSKKLAAASPIGELNASIEKGTKDKSLVLDLQKALLLADSYPPENKSLRQCPLTGNFGKCTLAALDLFQSRENITGEEGMAGEKTLKSLSKKLSNLGL